MINLLLTEIKQIIQRFSAECFHHVLLNISPTYSNMFIIFLLFYCLRTVDSCYHYFKAMASASKNEKNILLLQPIKVCSFEYRKISAPTHVYLLMYFIVEIYMHTWKKILVTLEASTDNAHDDRSSGQYTNLFGKVL